MEHDKNGTETLEFVWKNMAKYTLYALKYALQVCNFIDHELL